MKREVRLPHTLNSHQVTPDGTKAADPSKRALTEYAFSSQSAKEFPNQTTSRSTKPLGVSLEDAAENGEESQDDRRQRALLQDALAMAQHANQAKSVFLANMSHDFRTPMNSIMGFTNIALSHLSETDYVQDCLLKIQQSSQHLLRLLNDVLDVSRIESGKIHLNEQPMDLLDLADELKTMFEPEVKSRGLRMTIDFSQIQDTAVHGDQLRLSQIFINLIGNAVKFTEPGDIVMVKAVESLCLPANFGLFTFSVIDSGCGMSREFIEHLFEPFTRDTIEAVERTEGTGLGMTITKSLLDMMNGSIDVQSRLGVGTEFTVQIPLRLLGVHEDAAVVVPQPPALKDAQSPAADCLNGKSVLVVDDDLLSQELMEELLGEQGIIVDKANNGKEALEKVQRQTEPGYDAILMDVHMPVLDGVEATKAIRALPNVTCSQVPIIATTAGAFDDDRTRALKAGMSYHLTKPINMDELLMLLVKLWA